MNAFGDSAEGVGQLQPAEIRRGSRGLPEARTQFWGAAIVSSFFMIVLGTSLFLGAVMVIGTMRDGDSGGLTASGRAGRIARPLAGGTLCHYVIFDNKTDQTVEDRIGRCDESKPKPQAEKPATFNWGGK